MFSVSTIRKLPLRRAASSARLAPTMRSYGAALAATASAAGRPKSMRTRGRPAASPQYRGLRWSVSDDGCHPDTAKGPVPLARRDRESEVEPFGTTRAKWRRLASCAFGRRVRTTTASSPRVDTSATPLR